MGNPQDVKTERLTSLDAYRGFIMLVMASGGLGFVKILAHYQAALAGLVTSAANGLPPVVPGGLLPDVPFGSGWLAQFLAFQFEHVPWVGCSFWDLIQPSFMFMVGVAMPYSDAGRRARGDSWPRRFGHVLVRSAILILLGVFLSSNGARHTDFTFVNVLTQIGLGYAVVYLFLGRGTGVQLLGVAAILAGYWYLFYQHPLPGSDFNPAAVGVPGDWEPLTGLFAHWNKNANFAHDFDLWFMNLFPRPEPFAFNRGGYQTLNFVPSVATMLLGVVAGEVLRSARTREEKFRLLVFAGNVCLALGLVAGVTVCPIVKRIWTPSWVLFSAGWTFWFLAAFYWVIDLKGYRRWAFPLVVVGMNSIAMYCMAQLMKGWVRATWKTHAGQHLFDGFYGPLLDSAAILFALWLACLWMYRRKIFVRI